MSKKESASQFPDDAVTESSLSVSLSLSGFPVQETDQSENELVVTNTDQGNTATGRLIHNFLTSVKTFSKQLLDFTEKLEECLSLSQTNEEKIAELQKELKHYIEKFEKHCGEAAMVTELTRLSEDHEKLKQETKAMREEYDKKLKDLAERFQTPSSEVPVTETTKNEVPIASETGSGAELPLPVISDFLLKLDDLASQIMPKEVTIRRRSIRNNEVRTANSLPPKSDSFDDSESLQRTYSASSSGIGSSPPTLGRGDSKLFNIGEDENTPAADESLPPEVNSHSKTTSTPVRRGKSMSKKDHNILEVIWAMGDLANALKRLNEQ